MAKNKITIKSENIRNFCIVAHIDHGKSTLADRILEYTMAVAERDMKEQLLDNMDIERERGITIKARAVRTHFQSKEDNQFYRLNLIDTPGHVDFTYEVSRSLKACDGALLLIDATQGVEAQTLSNAYLAIDAGLEIIPVLNKVDLPHAEPERVLQEVDDLFGFDIEDFFIVSAKTGQGVPELLEGVIKRFPPPRREQDERLRALIFDAEYNDYRGVISYIKVLSGEISSGDDLYMPGTDTRCECTEVGYFSPGMTPEEKLGPGNVGYFISNLKDMSEVRVGDTLTHWNSGVEPLPGYQDPKKMVFCSLYPANNVEFEVMKKAMERLYLNDCSFSFQVEKSAALSFGFRCGFMGMLHMDVIRERLERESNLAIIQTAPHVTYEILNQSGEVITIETPSDMPNPSDIVEFREPMVLASILTPTDCIGAIITLAEERRGTYVKTTYLSEKRVLLEYRLPFNEVVFDFFDRLKSTTKGYATLDYQFEGFEKSDLVRVDILVNGEPVDALGFITHRSKAQYRGRAIIQRLQKEIPRHQFQIPLQASVGAKVIARENIKAHRKDVTAKCYGGDITRKRKLLEKQKEGKKRMKTVGNVTVPQEAFMAVLSLDDDQDGKKR